MTNQDFIVKNTCNVKNKCYLCNVFNGKHAPNIAKNIELHIIYIIEIIFNNKRVKNIPIIKLRKYEENYLYNLSIIEIMDSSEPSDFSKTSFALTM